MNDLQKFLSDRTFCPGPTPIPLQAQWTQIKQPLYHRSHEFSRIFVETAEILKKFFATQRNPLLLTSSGTGAMEAVMGSIAHNGSEVLVLEGGKFGERWTELANRFGCKTHVLKFPWGSAPNPSEVAFYLKSNPAISFVFFQACETSTGAYLPVKELCEAIKSATDAFIIVDAISSLAAHELRMDDWAIDAAIASSHKGFGAAAGVSFVVLSKRLEEEVLKNKSTDKRYYFDLCIEIENQKKQASAWSCASSIIECLHSSLMLIQERGIEDFRLLHKNTALALRSALEALDFELCAKEHFSFSITSAFPPKEVGAQKLLDELIKTYKMQLAPGQGIYQGKVIRFGHLGFFDPFDILAGVGILEKALASLKQEEVSGKGVLNFLKKFN